MTSELWILQASYNFACFEAVRIKFAQNLKQTWDTAKHLVEKGSCLCVLRGGVRKKGWESLYWQERFFFFFGKTNVCPAAVIIFTLMLSLLCQIQKVISDSVATHHRKTIEHCQVWKNTHHDKL